MSDPYGPPLIRRGPPGSDGGTSRRGARSGFGRTDTAWVEDSDAAVLLEGIDFPLRAADGDAPARGAGTPSTSRRRRTTRPAVAAARARARTNSPRVGTAAMGDRKDDAVDGDLRKGREVVRRRRRQRVRDPGDPQRQRAHDRAGGGRARAPRAPWDKLRAGPCQRSISSLARGSRRRSRRRQRFPFLRLFWAWRSCRSSRWAPARPPLRACAPSRALNSMSPRRPPPPPGRLHGGQRRRAGLGDVRRVHPRADVRHNKASSVNAEPPHVPCELARARLMQAS